MKSLNCLLLILIATHGLLHADELTDIQKLFNSGEGKSAAKLMCQWGIDQQNALRDNASSWDFEELQKEMAEQFKQVIAPERYYLRSERDCETAFEFIGELFSDENKGGGYGLDRGVLKTLGLDFINKCKAQKGSLYTKLARIEPFWLNIEEPNARHAATVSIMCWLAHRKSLATPWNYRLTEAWVADTTPKNKEFREMMTALIISMRGYQNFSSNTLANYGDIDVAPVLNFIQNESIPLRLRLAGGIHIFGYGKSLNNDPAIVANLFSFCDNLAIEKPYPGYHNDILYLSRMVIQQAACYSKIPDEIITALRNWDKHHRTSERQLTTREISALMGVLIWVGESKWALDFYDFHYDKQKMHASPHIIYTLASIGEYEKALSLLPTNGEPLNLNVTFPRPKDFYQKLDIFLEKVEDPALSLALQIHSIPISSEVPQLHGYEILERAIKCFNQLESVEGLDQFQQMRILGIFAYYPSLIPQLQDFVLDTAPRSSLFELYQQKTKDNPFFDSFLRYRYHALRIACAYQSGDLQLAKNLIEEILLLEEIEGSYIVTSYMKHTVQLLAYLLYQDTHKKSVEQFGEIHEFWVWLTHLNQPSHEIHSEATSCAKLAAKAARIKTTFEQIKSGTPEKHQLLFKNKHYYLGHANSSSFFEILTSNFFDWNDFTTGKEYRKQVMREHYSRPQFVTPDANCGINHFNYNSHLRPEWIIELINDQETSWNTKAFFVVEPAWQSLTKPNSQFVKEFKQPVSYWLENVDQLLKQKPNEPSEAGERLLWVILRTIKAKQLSTIKGADLKKINALLKKTKGPIEDPLDLVKRRKNEVKKGNTKRKRKPPNRKKKK